MIDMSYIFTSTLKNFVHKHITLTNNFTCLVVEGILSPVPHLSLSSVLHVPCFPINLLFVGQLTKVFNCFVTFFHTYYVFQDLSTRKTIGNRHLVNGVYQLINSLL